MNTTTPVISNDLKQSITQETENSAQYILQRVISECVKCNADHLKDNQADIQAVKTNNFLFKINISLYIITTLLKAH